MYIDVTEGCSRRSLVHMKMGKLRGKWFLKR